MDTSGMIAAASEMKAAETSYKASIKTMKMALDTQEMTGKSVLSLLSSGSANKAQEGADKGSLIDVIA